METFCKKLNDPGFFEENRERPHSDHCAFAPDDTDTGSLRMSLNGSWRFYYADNPALAPDGGKISGPETDKWDYIQVPGHIQLQGYDIPQYTNVQYPWDGRENVTPGQAPKNFNPTATYIRQFDVPDSYFGKRVFISFQGVESCFRVWLNGQYIGFSSDSFTPSDFEITKNISNEINRLVVQVYKWYSGSWLEDQDFFRFSGIFRDVFLYAAPEHHIRDIKVTADTVSDSLQEGIIEAEIECLKSGAVIRAVLTAPDNTGPEEQTFCVGEDGRGSVRFSVRNPLLWSAEQPYLYRLRLYVSDEAGEQEEWVEQKIGIRHFAIEDHIMKLNGRRIVFKGVNRHEFSTLTGRVVSEEELYRDLYTMKRSNINAIRLCHYPNSSKIYELADELGFYLIDECNMETHGTWDPVERGIRPASYALPGDHMEYQEMLLDRLYSMYARDKNHPSVLIWSLGNESFGGPVIREMSRAIKAWDPSRLIHYEGIFHDRRFPDTSDMESQMYTPASDIRKFLSENREKPFICCEYMHAMGNSCGDLKSYTDLTEEDELYQGGFIWDYADQAIRKTDRYGREFFAYGGDFGDRPNDGNFSGDGIVDARRNPTPKLAEVKYCYQDLSVRITEQELLITNHQLFTGTDGYDCIVRLEKDGKELRAVKMEVDVPPLGTARYTLPFSVSSDESGEYVLTASFRLKDARPWAEAGYETAFGQYVLQAGTSEKTNDSKGLSAWYFRSLFTDQGEYRSSDTEADELQVIRGDYNIGIRTRETEMLFSGLYGGLISYRYRGRELLKGMVRPNFWRAPTDNDRGCMLPFRAAQWKTASLYPDHKDLRNLPACFRLENPVIKESKERVNIIYNYYLPTVPPHSCSVSYEVYPDGTVQCFLEYTPPDQGTLPEFPEFAMAFQMDADYHYMEWYGRGPEDCYIDRRNGTRIGICRSAAEKEMAGYLRPQESGNHTDVRWMKITDRDGMGLLFCCPTDSRIYPEQQEEEYRQSGRDGLDISVSPYSPHVIENAQHPNELPPIYDTWIRIGQQAGVGGDDSWGSRVHEKYRLSSLIPRRISFLFCGICDK